MYFNVADGYKLAWKELDYTEGVNTEIARRQMNNNTMENNISEHEHMENKKRKDYDRRTS